MSSESSNSSSSTIDIDIYEAITRATHRLETQGRTIRLARLATQEREENEDENEYYSEQEDSEIIYEETKDVKGIKEYVKENQISTDEASRIMDIAEEVMNDNQYLEVCNFLKKAHKALPSEYVDHIVSFIQKIGIEQMASKELIVKTSLGYEKELNHRRVLEKQITEMEKKLKWTNEFYPEQVSRLEEELQKERKRRKLFDASDQEDWHICSVSVRPQISVEF